MVTATLTVEQHGDDLVLPVPDDVCAYLGVKPGDIIVMRQEGDRFLWSKPDTLERSVVIQKLGAGF